MNAFRINKTDTTPDGVVLIYWQYGDGTKDGTVKSCSEFHECNLTNAQLYDAF